MMLKREKAVGVMIDLQERLVPAISRHEQLVKDCAMLLEGLQILQVHVAATQQYTKGLGATLPQLQPYTNGEWIEKITFSCWGEPAFRELLERSGATQVIVWGTETHICVQQTVLDLLEAGYEVFLIADCSGSRFDLDHETGLRRMERAGAVLTTAEAALFELCERGGTEMFKAISKLVKGR